MHAILFCSIFFSRLQIWNDSNYNIIFFNLTSKWYYFCLHPNFSYWDLVVDDGSCWQNCFRPCSPKRVIVYLRAVTRASNVALNVAQAEFLVRCAELIVLIRDHPPGADLILSNITVWRFIRYKLSHPPMWQNKKKQQASVQDWLFSFDSLAEAWKNNGVRVESHIRNGLCYSIKLLIFYGNNHFSDIYLWHRTSLVQSRSQVIKSFSMCVSCLFGLQDLFSSMLEAMCFAFAASSTARVGGQIQHLAWVVMWT